MNTVYCPGLEMKPNILERFYRFISESVKEMTDLQYKVFKHYSFFYYKLNFKSINSIKNVKQTAAIGSPLII